MRDKEIPQIGHGFSMTKTHQGSPHSMRARATQSWVYSLDPAPFDNNSLKLSLWHHCLHSYRTGLIKPSGWVFIVTFLF